MPEIMRAEGRRLAPDVATDVFTPAVWIFCRKGDRDHRSLLDVNAVYRKKIQLSDLPEVASTIHAGDEQPDEVYTLSATRYVHGVTCPGVNHDIASGIGLIYTGPEYGPERYQATTESGRPVPRLDPSCDSESGWPIAWCFGEFLIRTPACAAGFAMKILLHRLSMTTITALVLTAAFAGQDRKEAAPRTPATAIIPFSGYDWRVKQSGDSEVGPGPNYFSANGVRVDADGLHLKAEIRNDRLYCVEIVSVQSFGFGTYRFETSPEVTQLDRNLVLGMFTWSDAPDYHHREIDIEISRWGQAGNDDAQFVVQPHTDPENIVRFMLPASKSAFSHTFTWMPGQVLFESRSGGALIKLAVMKHNVPEAGGENARINLWSMSPRLAGDGVTEVVIKRFHFEPAK